MRLHNDLSDAVEIREFADWILKIGDRKLGEPNDGEVVIDIPEYILMKNVQDPIASIVHNTYPNLIGKLSDGSLFYDRVVLAPTNEIVGRVNNNAMSLIHGKEKVYLSLDSISKADGFVNSQNNAFSVEFLNTIKCSGLPNHEISLKKGVLIILLRNIGQSAGLCNGTTLIVSHLGEHTIEAKNFTGCKEGDTVLIPRITLTPTDNVNLLVKIQRRQFPINIYFSMTINKSQRQSQLYVVVSRVTSRR